MTAPMCYEDPRHYLPRNHVEAFAKGTSIYEPGRPSGYLYMVLLGRIKISYAAQQGCETMVRLVCAEGLFGESCLVSARESYETAKALSEVSLISWTPDEIEEQTERCPKLGLALSQLMVRRSIALQERILAMSFRKMSVRVRLALIQLANESGTAMSDGFTRVPGLPHQVIAEYVGTQRETVTAELNRLRRTGVLRYSRKHIDISLQGMHETLSQLGISPSLSLTAVAASSAGGI